MASPASLEIVRVDHVTKRYGARGLASNVAALNDVSLVVTAGETLAIVGPSGSGKSTLIHMIAALDAPTSGEVRFEGRALATLGDDALTRLRRERIGFIFQSFQLLPTMTAIENVMLPALLAGESPSTARPRALARLDSVGLAARAHHEPDALSGGEMQRVAIARALILDPPLIVADEPTGNLDSAAGERILELLMAACASAAMRTLILVTHDAAIAARCRRTVRMRDGAIVSDAQNPAP